MPPGWTFLHASCCQKRCAVPLQVEEAEGRACFFSSVHPHVIPWKMVYIKIHLYLPIDIYIYIDRCGYLLSMNCVSSHFASFNVSKMLKIYNGLLRSKRNLCTSFSTTLQKRSYLLYCLSSFAPFQTFRI